MRWVRNLFVPTLRDYLHDQLGRDADVFDDQRLRDGPDFDEQLYENLAESALLVPVLTAAYFESDWCRREFATMREREEQLGIRHNGDTRTLIVPIYLSGKPRFPKRVQKMQWKEFWEYNNPDLAEGTARRAEFNDYLRTWSAEIVNAFEEVRPFEERYRAMRGIALLDDLVPPVELVAAPTMVVPID